MPVKWVPPDAGDLIKRYLAGESEKALAEAHGVGRNAIRRVLLAAGIRAKEPQRRHVYPDGQAQRRGTLLAR